MRAPRGGRGPAPLRPRPAPRRAAPGARAGALICGVRGGNNHLPKNNTKNQRTNNCAAARAEAGEAEGLRAVRVSRLRGRYRMDYYGAT